MSSPISRLRRIRTADESHRVTTFELFFDLVFVFAFTQVTQFMAHSHSALGTLQALIILSLLWWSWTSYSWLANQTRFDEGVMRLAVTVAMGAMFVVSLVIPETFEDLDGGLHGPMVFVVAYFVVRAVHLTMYLFAAGADSGLRRQVIRAVFPMLTGTALLAVGAAVGEPWQTWIWLAGFLLDLALTYVVSVGGGWRVHSAGHWAERYGLVIILALGESIVAIGVGASRLPVSWPLLAGSLLAVGLSVCLWWLYFDVIAIAAEHELVRLQGAARAALATDAYSYLHLPLIAGIITSALGVEEVIAHVAETEAFGLFGAAALLGGTTLYLVGHAVFWKRVGGTWKLWRLAVGALLLALIPVAALIPPLAALALVVALALVPVTAETLRYAEKRAKVRHPAPEP